LAGKVIRIWLRSGLTEAYCILFWLSKKKKEKSLKNPEKNWDCQRLKVAKLRFFFIFVNMLLLGRS